MVPCMTVSIHTVAASTPGAAGSRFLNAIVTPIRARAPTDDWMILFLVFGLGSRAMSTITSLLKVSACTTIAARRSIRSLLFGAELLSHGVFKIRQLDMEGV